MVPPGIQASDRVLESINDLRNVETIIGSTVRMLQTARLTFICQATGIPVPTIMWRLNGKLLEKTVRISIKGDSLTLTDLKEEDTGVITCTARNVGGNFSVASQLTVVGKYQVIELQNDFVYINKNLKNF